MQLKVENQDATNEEVLEWVSFWKPNVTVNLVEDFTRYPNIWFGEISINYHKTINVSQLLKRHKLNEKCYLMHNQSCGFLGCQLVSWGFENHFTSHSIIWHRMEVHSVTQLIGDLSEFSYFLLGLAEQWFTVG